MREPFPHNGCATCGCQHSAARDIMYRLNSDPSFSELWHRLDQAERDRNRMLNALQHIRDQKHAGKLTLPPRVMTIINRALSKVEPSIAPPTRLNAGEAA